MKLRSLIFSLMGMLGLSGCASLGTWFGENVAENVPFLGAEPPLKYSETPQAGVLQDREYKRMTKAKLEEESDLGSGAGSLWVMEGQTSYMFAQNKTRREGDALSVKMEGAAIKQVETKANNIRALLKELEEEEKRRKGLVQPEQAPPALAQGADGKPAAPAPATRAPSAEKPKEEKIDLTDVQAIQSKIVERTPDGNYKIKGSQSFMIDKKEYKAIISGTVKAEDFNDQGVSSNKLIEPQYDVVSVRRAMKDENSF